MSLGFFANNMSFKAIIKATFWKNDDTFVNYYLRDIRVTLPVRHLRYRYGGRRWLDIASAYLM